LRLHRLVDAGWALFAFANVAAMLLWPSWETIPFHFIWVSLTLLYGFRVWPLAPTLGVLAAVCVVTGNLILGDIHSGNQEWGELSEVPLMSAMFLAMVWHARRRQAATRQAVALAESRASLLGRQERFLHDVSHELRTPVTIARGHLDLLRVDGRPTPELTVALEELDRIDRILNRLLLLAKAGRPDFLAAAEIDVERFVEDVFVRWSDFTPRVWRLGPLAQGTVWADEEALRIALDAMLENAVKYTEPHEQIELRAVARGSDVVLEVADGGSGLPDGAAERIFERFARADDARTRSLGGAGLGLAIVDAIARAHGGRCLATAQPRGTVFALRLPHFVSTRRSAADWAAVSGAAPGFSASS
jgi:signal transduction histidine kinase